MASSSRIAVHSIADLKNTSDDAIPTYLNSLKFKQSHSLSDTRLVLGYSAFFVSAATFAWDYKLGFESTKYYTAAAVALYALLNTALTFWIWGVEKGTVYVGTSPTGEKINISTSTKKHDPTYYVTIIYTPASKTTPITVKLSKPFTQWFDSAGHFVALPFQQLFASQVPVIGKADPLRALTAPGGADKSSFQDVDMDPATLKAAMDGILAGTKVPATPKAAFETEGAGSVKERKSGKGKKKA